ncbi:MAG: polysaccharide deacetylase family protein [Bacteroidota bacterium]
MFYLPNTPAWLRMIFPYGVVWKGDPANNAVYLTFDDGPDPGATQFVLDQLEKYNIQATFFCIGDNVVKYPLLFEKVKAAGHRVGNHTMHHPNGWTTENTRYVNEIMEAHQLIQSDLFRPPYGKITSGQARELRKKELGIAKKELGIGREELRIKGKSGIQIDQRSDIRDRQMKIIMWSVIAGDFDKTIDGNVCYNHIVKYTRPGSIIVFHDSQKAFPRLKVALPKTLEWIREKGYIPTLL